VMPSFAYEPSNPVGPSQPIKSASAPNAEGLSLLSSASIQSPRAGSYSPVVFFSSLFCPSVAFLSCAHNITIFTFD
jgi:hypothetical protein